MDDTIGMVENKTSLAKSPSLKKKSKYTNEQKIAAVEALEISKKLNKMLDKTLAKYENK